MSQYTPLEFTIPDNINYPEFSSKNETNKILKLVSSGVLRTHSDTFNSLDASYLNNLPGPRVEISQTFEEMYNKFLTDTTISPNINIPNEVITNWESDILERFANHLNKNKMYLIDEILPKIPTMIPEIIKEDEPIKTRYKKYFECVFTKTFYIDSVKKLELQNSVNIDIKTFLVLAGKLKSTDNEILIEGYLQNLEDTTFLYTLEVNPKISINGNVPIPNAELHLFLEEIRNIEKTLILYQKHIFNASEKEKKYIKEYTEPKLLEDLIELTSINNDYPKISEKNLKALQILFTSLKIFWLFDTEITGLGSDSAKTKLYNDLVIKDTIEFKPKFKEV